MQAQIQTLLNEKDKVEKIRDAIALYLKNRIKQSICACRNGRY